MNYDEYQIQCERDFQEVGAGAVQLRGRDGGLLRRSESLDEIERHWEPGLGVWKRHTDARGPYWRAMA